MNFLVDDLLTSFSPLDHLVYKSPLTPLVGGSFFIFLSDDRKGDDEFRTFLSISRFDLSTHMLFHNNLTDIETDACTLFPFGRYVGIEESVRKEVFGNTTCMETSRFLNWCSIRRYSSITASHISHPEILPAR